MERIVLHSDMNSFYASVEQAQRPELRGRPVVVAGKEELRHGIVLTKSEEAKAYGIRTAETLWQARQEMARTRRASSALQAVSSVFGMARAVYNQSPTWSNRLA